MKFSLLNTTSVAWPSKQRQTEEVMTGRLRRIQRPEHSVDKMNAKKRRALLSNITFQTIIRF